jgi:signal peptidase I
MKRFKKGDVITFKINENTLVTHRITEVIKNPTIVMYKTKGDNNKSPDVNPVISDNVVAEYKGFTIPYLGYIISFTSSKNGAFLMLLPGLLLLGYSIYTIWRTLKQLDKNNSKSTDSLEKTF